MSVVAPLAATAAIIPAVYGLAIGEQPSALALGGVGLAVVGVGLAGRSADPGDQNTLARGVGLAAALRFGLGFVTLDAASEGSVVWTLLANRLGSVIVLLVAWGVDAWAATSRPRTTDACTSRASRSGHRSREAGPATTRPCSPSESSISSP